MGGGTGADLALKMLHLQCEWTTHTHHAGLPQAVGRGQFLCKAGKGLLSSVCLTALSHTCVRLLSNYNTAQTSLQ